MLLLALIGSLILFGRGFGYDFVFDDVFVVQQNPLLERLSHIPRLFAMPYLTREAGLYRPFTMASFALNRVLLGSSPWGFHLVNVLLHGINAWLLYRLIQRVGGTQRLAQWTGLWFLVLPIHTEAVAGIVGRAELLSLMGSLAALLVVLGNSGSSLRRAIRAGVVGWLALASKESAITLVPLAVCVAALRSQRQPLGQRLKAARASLFGLTGALLVYLAMRVAVLGPHVIGTDAGIVENPLLVASMGTRIATAVKILGLYLEKSLWPVTLSSDYSYNQVPVVTSIGDASLWVGAIALAGAVWLIAAALRSVDPTHQSASRGWWGMAASLFLWPYLPVSNLIVPIGTNMAERLLYAPSVGLCLMLGLAADRSWSWRPPAERVGAVRARSAFRMIAIGLVIGYACRSIVRTGDWRNEATLYLSAAEASPHSVRAIANRGTVALLSGDLDAAERDLLAAHEIYPGYFHAEYDLGILYELRRRDDLAERQFLKALQIIPGYARAYEQLAFIYVQQGRDGEARAVLRQRYRDANVAERALQVLTKARGAATSSPPVSPDRPGAP